MTYWKNFFAKEIFARFTFTIQVAFCGKTLVN